MVLKVYRERLWRNPESFFAYAKVLQQREYKRNNIRGSENIPSENILSESILSENTPKPGGIPTGFGVFSKKQGYLSNMVALGIPLNTFEIVFLRCDL